MNCKRLAIGAMLCGTALFCRCCVIGGTIGSNMNKFVNLAPARADSLKPGTPVIVYQKDRSGIEGEFIRIVELPEEENASPGQAVVVMTPDSNYRTIPLSDIKFIRFKTGSNFKSCGMGCGAAVDAVIVFWVIVAIYVTNRGD